MKAAIAHGNRAAFTGCRTVRQRFLNLWDTVRSSYWFVPGIVLFLVTAAAEALIWLDRSMASTGKRLPEWVPQLRESVAEQLLLAIASASVSLATLVFSITLIVLTLTTGNYGPRLLRRFMGDTPTQIVLGLYTATLVYCLLVLRSTASVGEERFVPHLAVSGVMAIAIADVLMLMYFMHHVSGSIHVTSMLWSVSSELDSALEDVFPEELGEDERDVEEEQSRVTLQGEWRAVEALTPGYLRSVDADGLMRFAKQEDVVVRIPRVGTFVGSQALAQITSSGPLGEEAKSRLRQLFIVGNSRTPHQDVEYSLDRLVEMAARALSPGVNDPFTAISCLDQAEHALSRLARRRFPSPRRLDEHGHLRVIAASVQFDELLIRTLDPIRQYGRGQWLVIKRLLEVLGTVAGHTPTPARRRAVGALIERVWLGCCDAEQNDPAMKLLRPVYDRARETAEGLSAPKIRHGSGT